MENPPVRLPPVGSAWGFPELEPGAPTLSLARRSLETAGDGGPALPAWPSDGTVTRNWEKRWRQSEEAALPWTLSERRTAAELQVRGQIEFFYNQESGAGKTSGWVCGEGYEVRK